MYFTGNHRVSDVRFVVEAIISIVLYRGVGRGGGRGGVGRNFIHFLYKVLGQRSVQT